MQRKNNVKKLKQLGKMLEQARGNRSLVEVSEKIGLSFGYLSKLERGEVARPKIEMLNRLIKFYKLDYDEVVYLADKIAEDIYWKVADNRRLWEIIRAWEV